MHLDAEYILKMCFLLWNSAGFEFSFSHCTVEEYARPIVTDTTNYRWR